MTTETKRLSWFGPTTLLLALAVMARMSPTRQNPRVIGLSATYSEVLVPNPELVTVEYQVGSIYGVAKGTSFRRMPNGTLLWRRVFPFQPGEEAYVRVSVQRSLATVGCAVHYMGRARSAKAGPSPVTCWYPRREGTE